MSVVPLFLTSVISPSVMGITTVNVFWVFLKIGLVLYGSGYVLFAYLDAELVSKGWLTSTELMDAIAVGQFTPGPILSTATFIGYQLTGFWGAVLASVGLFLPSFLLVLILNPLVPKIRKSATLGYFLDSVNIAAVAVIAGVLLTMGAETLTDWKRITIAVVSIGLTFGYKKMNAMWAVIGGSVLGYLLTLI